MKGIRHGTRSSFERGCECEGCLLTSRKAGADMSEAEMLETLSILGASVHHNAGGWEVRWPGGARDGVNDRSLEKAMWGAVAMVMRQWRHDRRAMKP